MHIRKIYYQQNLYLYTHNNLQKDFYNYIKYTFFNIRILSRMNFVNKKLNYNVNINIYIVKSVERQCHCIFYLCAFSVFPKHLLSIELYNIYRNNSDAAVIHLV